MFVDNAMNAWRLNFIFSAKLFHADFTSGVTLSNFHDIILSQMGVVILFSMQIRKGMPCAFFDCIMAILFICYSPEMFWIATSWPVIIWLTVVKYAKLVWDWAFCEDVGCSWSGNHFTINSSPNLSVTSVLNFCQPWPAVISQSSVYFTPKSLWEIFRQSLRLEVLRRNLRRHGQSFIKLFLVVLAPLQRQLRGAFSFLTQWQQRVNLGFTG